MRICVPMKRKSGCLCHYRPRDPAQAGHKGRGAHSQWCCRASGPGSWDGVGAAYGSEALWKRRALKRDRQSSASGPGKAKSGQCESGEKACTSVCCTRESALGGSWFGSRWQKLDCSDRGLCSLDN